MIDYFCWSKNITLIHFNEKIPFSIRESDYWRFIPENQYLILPENRQKSDETKLLQDVVND